MTYQIIDMMQRIAQPLGAAVLLAARHLCTQMRGVREDAAETKTIVWRGAYEQDARLQHTFLRLAAQGPCPGDVPPSR